MGYYSAVIKKELLNSTDKHHKHYVEWKKAEIPEYGSIYVNL